MQNDPLFLSKKSDNNNTNNNENNNTNNNENENNIDRTSPDSFD